MVGVRKKVDRNILEIEGFGLIMMAKLSRLWENRRKLGKYFCVGEGICVKYFK